MLALPRKPAVLLALTVAGAAGALALVSVTARRSFRALEAAAAQRQTAYEFLMALRRTRQHVGEIRVGLTGYALTRDSLYHATYGGAFGALAGDTVALRTLARGQPALQEPLDRLGLAVQAYAEVMAAAMRRAEGSSTAVIVAELRTSRDVLLLEGVRGAIVALEGEQTRLMDVGAREVTAAVRRSRAIISGVLLLGVVGVVGAGGALVVQLRGRERAEKEIRQLNVALEARVVERTAQLEAANKELEAFAYSVSHDLRAPLRTVDGFSKILLEEYGTRLDEEGKRVAGVVRSTTQRMGRLIDDLLAFSRLGRERLRVGRVDMEQLVRTVIEEVTAVEPTRKIEFSVGPLPLAVGDLSLLKQVWLNLLSNAAKYTRPRPRAVIEVNGTVAADETVYTVRDNGVGFDMQYVGKLFGVFQRLHQASEFEGTGVGLALVQRIVHRHGGRVWAQGNVDQGAIFSFSLPGSESGVIKT